MQQIVKDDACLPTKLISFRSLTSQQRHVPMT